MYQLEDVFKKSGLPNLTFVEPSEYNKIKVSLRTKGRGLVVEGPSGIGKTTCIKKAIVELNNKQEILELNSRDINDIDLIKSLPEMDKIGLVIIDDFHVLKDEIKNGIANFMKLLAEKEDQHSKIIIIGINRAGDSLVRFASDLNNRIDTVRFEKNSDSKIAELIRKGEDSLNIEIERKEELVKLSSGSFHLAQLFCFEYCINASVIERQSVRKIISNSVELIKESVIEEIGRVFHGYVREFSIGTKLKRAGRAPYLNLLKWLAESESWSVQMDEIILQKPYFKGSLSQIIEKGFLSSLLTKKVELQKVLHYDSYSKVLAIEDPKFLFYLKNLSWKKISRDIGFSNIDFSSKYDFALSFAGENRDLSAALFDSLIENEIEVFYDKNEQHRMLAENVEEYLAPIYRSEATYIIVILSNFYPKKIWTKFESDQFKHRFGEGSIIPIVFADMNITQFDITDKIGYLMFDPNGPIKEQLSEITETLLKKIESKRSNGV